MKNVKINNLPNYANDYEFIVARKSGGEYWFWGAYSDVTRAERAAMEIGGAVIRNA